MAHVLVADNDTQVNDLITSLLRMEGWDVESVHDGEAALEALRARPAALLVCDLDMPRMDGFALVEAVSALEEPQPVILVVTGFTDPVVQQQLAARGPVHAVWLKPFDLDAFCAEVRGLLEVERGAHGEPAPPERPSAHGSEAAP